MNTRKWIAAGWLILVALVSPACGLGDTAVNPAGGDDAMTAIDALWRDVPPMDGMTASRQFGMPVWLKTLAGPVMDAMLKELGASQWEWTGFTLNGPRPADVQAFYTPERMARSGWRQSSAACVPMTDKGVLCSFMKEAAGRTTGLIVLAATDDQQKETSVFFLRAEGVQSAPTPLKEDQTPAAAASALPTLAPAQDMDGDGQIDVCEIIPQSVLEEAMGRALIAPGQPFSDPALGEGCAYDFGSDGSATCFAYVTLASEQQFNNALANAVRAEPVTTIGDSAFLSYGPDARQLWVRAGGKAALVAIGDRENIPAAMLFARYLIEFATASAGN